MRVHFWPMVEGLTRSFRLFFQILFKIDYFQSISHGIFRFKVFLQTGKIIYINIQQ